MLKLVIAVAATTVRRHTRHEHARGRWGVSECVVS